MPATISYPKTQALRFQGGNIQVPAHADFDLQRQLTIAAWLFPPAPSEFAAIVGAGPAAYQLGVTNGRVVFSAGREYASSGSVGGAWVQLVVTFDADADADQLKLYLDGELDQSITVATPLAASASGILIGTNSEPSPFQGLIASVAIWNSAHSAWRIKQELSSPIDTRAADLVAYWAMEEGSGTTVRDSSPNGHDGTIQGAVQWAALNGPIVLNGAAVPAGPANLVEAILAGGPRTTALGQALHAPSPPTGRAGEAQKLLHRVELYNQQKLQQARLDANAKLAAAKQAAADKLQQAHQDAARAINSTRYDVLYYLRDGFIWQVDAAGNQKAFGWTENRSTILGLVAGQWIDSHVKVTPPDAINLRLVVAPPDMGVTVAIRIGTGYQFTFGNGGAGNITGQSGTISAFLDWGPTGNPPVVGGTPTFMVQISGPIPDPVPALDLAVDPARALLFWTEPLPPYRLRCIGTDGSVLRDLVPSSPTPITSIALAEITQLVYYADSTGAVFSVPYAGGQPTPIAAFPGQPGDGRSRLAFHTFNNCLYRTSEVGILSAVQNNGPVTLCISSTHAPAPVDVVGDGLGAKLYWTDRELKAVRRANLDGSAPEDLYFVADPVPGLAIDDVLPAQGADLPREIYWCERREGISRDTPGIQAYWPLDDGDGAHARVVAGPGTPARIGSFRRVPAKLPAGMAAPPFAARFDGDPFYARLPQEVSDSLIGASFTLELWLRPELVLAGDDVEIMAGTDTDPNHCFVLLIRDRKPYFGFSQNDTQGSAILHPHQWVHLACRYDSARGEQAIFVNGELDSINTGRAPLAAPVGYPILLGQSSEAKNPYRGEMAGLHVTSKPLGQDEIRSHLRKAPPGELLSRIRSGPAWASDDPPPVLHPPRAYLALDGFDQVKLADDAATLQIGDGPFTVECWVKVPALDDDGAEVSLVVLGTVMPGGRSVSFGVRDGSPSVMYQATDLLAGAAPLAPDRWTHLAWRYEELQLSLLVNGVLTKQVTSPMPIAGQGTVYIGRDLNGFAGYGALSELRLWSVARSDAEIAGSFRNFRQVLAMRGPVDGSRRPEALPQVTGGGAIALASRASADHEQRLIAYRKRQDAQAKAAADVAAAHADYEAQLSAKQAALEKTHQESAAAISAKAQEQAQTRADNRQRLTNAQNDATGQVQVAQSSAAQKLAATQSQAQNLKDQASAQAQSIKDQAQANYNNAQAARAKYP